MKKKKQKKKKKKRKKTRKTEKKRRTLRVIYLFGRCQFPTDNKCLVGRYLELLRNNDAICNRHEARESLDRGGETNEKRGEASAMRRWKRALKGTREVEACTRPGKIESTAILLLIEILRGRSWLAARTGRLRDQFTFLSWQCAKQFVRSFFFLFPSFLLHLPLFFYAFFFVLFNLSLRCTRLLFLSSSSPRCTERPVPRSALQSKDRARFATLKRARHLLFAGHAKNLASRKNADDQSLRGKFEDVAFWLKLWTLACFSFLDVKTRL